MTEEEWGSDFDQPLERRSGVKPLAWVFGSGCLLIVILAIVALVWGARLFGKATDPDIQWPRVAEVLPFEQRPAGLRIVGFPGRAWMITPPDGDHQILLMHSSGASDAQRELFFGQAERFKLEVQGRELTAVRPEVQPRDGAGPGGSLMSRLSPGPSIMVELSPPEARDLVMLQFKAVGSKEPVPEKLVIDFLDRFQVGEMR
jgi:hypothetical protein